MTLPDRAALTLSGVSKRFGATVALDDVSIDVRAGTVHALLGENGAGKTTLMRVAFGLIAPDAGTISVEGVPHAFAAASDAIAAGLGMVHQHFTNVPSMTVAENVALGGHGSYDRHLAAEHVREIGRFTGLTLDPAARVETLSVGAQQRLEIVKALARRTRTLILDEPTAVLAPAEADELLKWIRAFADDGNAVVLITHKLREALSVADDVTVLRRGRRVLTAPAANTNESGLTADLLGEDPSSSNAALSMRVGDVVARLDGVGVVDDRGVAAVHDATLEIRGGEIVGIAAIEGAGQHELLRILAARVRATRGDVSVPAEIGFVPEDRHRDALVLDFSPTDNVRLRGAGTRHGMLHVSEDERQTETLITEFDVRGAGGDRAVRTLSGGNQQKLVLGRELRGAPAMLVAENPTRGLDIRATRAVHDRLRAAAAAGAAVVVYSSDVDEVLSLATRVLVMHGGHVRETSHSRDEVGRAMLGVA